MKASITPKQLAQAEAEFKTEAEAIEKLRVQLLAHGAAANKKRIAEFAKRQKAFLDRKINFERNKRSLDASKPEPAKASIKSPKKDSARKAR